MGTSGNAVCMYFQWTDCMTIGRDLVRLLQGVARVPEIEKLWKDILHNPSSLSPTFTGKTGILVTLFCAYTHFHYVTFEVSCVKFCLLILQEFTS